MPEPTRPRRRINPDKPPYNGLPLLRADTHDGPISVTRGEFDIAELTDDQRDLVQANPEHDYVVFTNPLGQHELAQAGELTAVDLSRVGNLPDDIVENLIEDIADRVLVGYPRRAYRPQPGDRNLDERADWLRFHAQELLDAADQYDALAAAGWVPNPDEATADRWSIVNTGPGPSHEPRRRD